MGWGGLPFLKETPRLDANHVSFQFLVLRHFSPNCFSFIPLLCDLRGRFSFTIVSLDSSSPSPAGRLVPSQFQMVIRWLLGRLAFRWDATDRGYHIFEGSQGQSPPVLMTMTPSMPASALTGMLDARLFYPSPSSSLLLEPCPCQYLSKSVATQ